MNPTKRVLYLLAGAFLLIVETGCFQPYRMDVQQGNVVTAEQIQRLQTGMTRREAQFVLGTPLIEDPFHANRWDYLFSLRQGETGHTDQNHLTLLFEGDSLVEVLYKESDQLIPVAKSENHATDSLRTRLFQRLWDRIRLDN